MTAERTTSGEQTPKAGLDLAAARFTPAAPYLDIRRPPDWGVGLGGHADPEAAAGVGVHEGQGRRSVLQVFVAPLHQRQENRQQIFPRFGQAVLVPGSAARLSVRSAGNDLSGLELFERTRHRRRRCLNPLYEILESRCTEAQFADDLEGRLGAQQLEDLRHRPAAADLPLPPILQPLLEFHPHPYN